MSIVTGKFSNTIQSASVMLALCLICGCQKRTDDSLVATSTTPKLKSFLSDSDQLSLMQRLDTKTMTIPATHKDEMTGSYKSTWVPATLTVTPLTVEEVNKKDSKLRGAAFQLTDEYNVVSGEGSPTVGKHDSGSAVLDDDELVDLQNAIPYVRERSADWSKQAPPVTTVVLFKSKDGLKVGLVQDSGKKWIYELSIDPVSIYPNEAQLNDLVQQLGVISEELKQH